MAMHGSSSPAGLAARDWAPRNLGLLERGAHSTGGQGTGGGPQPSPFSGQLTEPEKWALLEDSHRITGGGWGQIEQPVPQVEHRWPIGRTTSSLAGVQSS